ncbi:MAG: hypothetical protein GX096_04690 [Clostridiales bacterium]|nr:hypothetical protein [Clostridiales bacterium]
MVNSKQMKRPWLRGILRNSLILVGGIAVGFLLLLAVYALPVDRMEDNVMLSLPTFDGTWGSGEESYEQLLKGYRSTQLDNSTDSLMLLTAINRSDEPLTKQVANVYAYTGSSGLPYLTLREMGEADFDNSQSTARARYWLGYLVVLKPLLMVMTYMDVRMLNMLGQGGLVLAIILLMQKRGLGRYIVPFAVSLVCLSPIAMPFSMQFSTVFYVFAIAMVLMLWKPKFAEEKIGMSTFFLLIGMMTSFIDFLTYPIASFGMPFLLLMLLRKDNDKQAKTFVQLGIWWVVGYFGMWAGKWLIAGLFGGEEYFWYNLLSTIDTRSSMESASIPLSYMDVLGSVMSVFAKKPYLLLGGGIAIGCGVSMYRSRGNRKVLKPSYALLMALVSVLPFLWYLGTSNHTYNHAFFTSRGLIVTVFGLLCLITGATEQKQRIETK